MSFSGDIHRHNARRTEVLRRTFVYSTQEVQRSVVHGSAITGAKGQPVDEGNLIASWIGEYFGAFAWQLSTNVNYAPMIEAGGNSRAAFTLRSQVGGFHSVKMTRTSWDRVAEFSARRAASEMGTA